MWESRIARRMCEKMKADQERVKHLLTDTVTLLCKNGLQYSEEIQIEALVGITVDHHDVFFVHISEAFPSSSAAAAATTVENKIKAEAVDVQKKAVSTPVQSRAATPSTAKAILSQKSSHTHVQSPSSSYASSNSSPAQQASPLPQHQLQQAVESMPCRQMLQSQSGNTASDDEDVVVVSQEPAKLKNPSKVAHAAVKVAGQKRVLHQSHGQQQNVTVIAPVNDISLDDTQAMQQGYSKAPADLSVHRKYSDYEYEQVNESGEPLKKRCILDSDQSNNGYMSGYGEKTQHTDPANDQTIGSAWSNVSGLVGEFSGQLSGDGSFCEPASPQSSSLPGCSSWQASTGGNQVTSGSEVANSFSSPVRGYKNPRNNTMCQPVRDVLESSLANPVLLEAKKVTAFRLFWRGHDTVQGWHNIIYNRLELDALIADHPGVSFFISAITATARDIKTSSGNIDARLRAYPALGYWVASRESDFDQHFLMKRLTNAATGAELKTMLQSDGEKMTEVAALNLIVKDYGKGYVQQRVSESASVCCSPGEEHPTIRFILKEDYFEERLREAVDLLNGVGCPVSLEKVDLEAIENEQDMPEEEEEEHAGGTTT